MTAAELRTDTQLAFALRLGHISERQLGVALAQAIGDLQIPELDRQYARLLSNDRLARLAQFGLRAETFFPCVAVLTKQPYLLAYYRLLYGFSQKSFYREFGAFKAMEEKGTLTPRASAGLADLCAALCDSGWPLLANLPTVSLHMIRDLQLLTLGPQLRGGLLNEIGKAAAEMVLQRIRAGVSDDAVISSSAASLVLQNSSGRRVTVAFSSDPDIAISEDLSASVINKLAIEIKGGTDVSNIHNRLGEAEKSHQKARAKGFTEFWTIKNAEVDLAVAARESPTTNLFFDLSTIIDPSHPDWIRFRDELTARLGVPASTGIA